MDQLPYNLKILSRKKRKKLIKINNKNKIIKEFYKKRNKKSIILKKIKIIYKVIDIYFEKIRPLYLSLYY